MDARKHLTFFKVSLVYLYFGLALTRFANIPEIARSFLALPTFVLLPLLIGVVLVGLVKLSAKNKILGSSEIAGSTYFTLCLIMGFFFTELMAVIFQILNLRFLLQNIGYLSLGAATSGFLFFTFSGHRDMLGSSIDTCLKKYWKPMLLLTCVAISPILVKLLFVPPPLTEWNSWSNPIALVQAPLRLLNQGFFDITQRWMEILFTAISCQIFNISAPEFFMYEGTILVTTIFAVGVFALTRRFSSKTWVAVLCGSLSIFLNTPFGIQEIPTYHFKSNTLLICLSPWVILLTIDILRKQPILKIKNVLALILPIGLFFTGLTLSSSLINTLYSYGISYETQLGLFRPLIILLVPLAAAISYFLSRQSINTLTVLLLASTVLYTANDADFIPYIAALLFFILIYYFITAVPRKGHILLRTASLLFFTLIFLEWSNVITLPDIPVSALIGLPQPSTTSFPVKQIVFSGGNSTIILYLFALGIALLIFSSSQNDLLALGLLTSFFLMFFFPEFWSIRILGMTTPFLAYAISKNFNLMSRLSQSLIGHHRKVKIATYAVLASLFFLSLVTNLVNPLYTKFSSFPPSQMATYEYKAAVWLRENTAEKEVIVSDYWTMMLLNSMSNKIWLTDRQYMASDLSPEHQELLTGIKDKIFGAPNSSVAYYNIQAMTPEMRLGIDWTEKYYMKDVGITPDNITFLIVLSSRTVAWFGSDGQDVPGQYYDTVDPQYLAVFNNPSRFEQLANFSGQLYVFKVVRL